jgi:hypothetical protein
MVDIDEEEKLEKENLSAELLRLHHTASFGKLKALARPGIVHPKPANVPTSCCSACLHGKATRRAWHQNPNKADQRTWDSKISQSDPLKWAIGLATVILVD